MALSLHLSAVDDKKFSNLQLIKVQRTNVTGVFSQEWGVQIGSCHRFWDHPGEEVERL